MSDDLRKRVQEGLRNEARGKAHEVSAKEEMELAALKRDLEKPNSIEDTMFEGVSEAARQVLEDDRVEWTAHPGEHVTRSHGDDGYRLIKTTSGESRNWDIQASLHGVPTGEKLGQVPLDNFGGVSFLDSGENSGFRLHPKVGVFVPTDGASVRLTGYNGIAKYWQADGSRRRIQYPDVRQMGINQAARMSAIVSKEDARLRALIEKGDRLPVMPTISERILEVMKTMSGSMTIPVKKGWVVTPRHFEEAFEEKYGSETPNEMKGPKLIFIQGLGVALDYAAIQAEHGDTGFLFGKGYSKMPNGTAVTQLPTLSMLHGRDNPSAPGVCIFYQALGQHVDSVEVDYPVVFMATENSRATAIPYPGVSSPKLDHFMTQVALSSLGETGSWLREEVVNRTAEKAQKTEAAPKKFFGLF